METTLLCPGLLPPHQAPGLSHPRSAAVSRLLGWSGRLVPPVWPLGVLPPPMASSASCVVGGPRIGRLRVPLRFSWLVERGMEPSPGVGSCSKLGRRLGPCPSEGRAPLQGLRATWGCFPLNCNLNAACHKLKQEEKFPWVTWAWAARQLTVASQLSGAAGRNDSKVLQGLWEA